MYVPPQTPRQGVFPSADFPTLASQFQTDIQHGIDRTRRVPTPLTRHIALQLSRKRLVDDTVARDIRRPATCPVNLVERGDEKLVGVLLRVTGHFCRDFPSGGEERRRSEWRLIRRVYLGIKLEKWRTERVAARSQILFRKIGFLEEPGVGLDRYGKATYF